MKNSKALFLDLVNQIKISESREEIQSLVYILLENILAISRTDVLAERQISLTDDQTDSIDDAIRRINSEEPVQYILGEAPFYGRTFEVGPCVLIPRPETEELVSVVLGRFQRTDRASGVRILDVGTGSGCIAVTLGLEIGGAEIFATDIDHCALEIARRNVARWNVNVALSVHDILVQEISVGDLDIVVSNPPYIGNSEKHDMKGNVVLFEPHKALFVPDDDPLIFYRAIVQKSRCVLRKGGILAVEINSRYGKEVGELFSEFDYGDVEIIGDLFGKERIVKGCSS